MGMGIAYFVLSMILSKYGFDKIVFPIYIMLYGLGTFVSGSIIQFRPLVIGGITASALAIGSTFADYDYQMLFGAVAILISYIIPAYMLRHRNKHAND
jgi:low temperature requirement protein LtrA